MSYGYRMPNEHRGTASGPIGRWSLVWAWLRMPRWEEASIPLRMGAVTVVVVVAIHTLTLTCGNASPMPMLRAEVCGEACRASGGWKIRYSNTYGCYCTDGKRRWKEIER